MMTKKRRVYIIPYGRRSGHDLGAQSHLNLRPVTELPRLQLYAHALKAPCHASEYAVKRCAQSQVFVICG
jgi:hypothetical protein